MKWLHKSIHITSVIHIKLLRHYSSILINVVIHGSLGEMWLYWRGGGG